LAVIGTERHEARRIDNQLRGRSGRQGDPGSTQFYLSLEDDLMRLFGGDRMMRIGNLMQRTDMPEDMPIDSGMVSKAIESAQRQVESMHFDTRKRVLEYDDVMNRQREAIYNERNAILDGKDIHERAADIMQDTVEKTVSTYFSDVPDDWDWNGFSKWFEELTGEAEFDAHSLIKPLASGGSDGADVPRASRTLANDSNDPEVIAERLFDHLSAILEAKETSIGEDKMRQLESQIMLRIMDSRWMNHLQEMDYLKTGIGLRAFGQRDPLTEYKTEAHTAFGELRDSMYDDYLRTLLRIQIIVPEEETPDLRQATYSGPSDNTPSTMSAVRAQATANAAARATGIAPDGSSMPAKTKTINKQDDPFANSGRNDPCPCGSGKKFKNCHGAPGLA
jgi:preprotein translocase subunit SecA